MNSPKNQQPKHFLSTLLSRLPKRKPTEAETLLHTLDDATPVMSEVELLLEEMHKCREKLAELEALRDAPRKASRIPVLRHLVNASRNVETADLQSQISAYRSMLAGLKGHLLQIVLHQCRSFLFLGDYLYPIAVSELKKALASGAAETLQEAIDEYEATLARWRENKAEQGRLKKQEAQAREMAEILREAKFM